MKRSSQRPHGVMHQVTATKAIDSRSRDQMGRISGAGRACGLRCGGRGNNAAGVSIRPRPSSARRTEPTNSVASMQSWYFCFRKLTTKQFVFSKYIVLCFLNKCFQVTSYYLACTCKYFFLLLASLAACEVLSYNWIAFKSIYKYKNTLLLDYRRFHFITRIVHIRYTQHKGTHPNNKPVPIWHMFTEAPKLSWFTN